MKGKLYITNSVNDVVSYIFDVDFDHQHLVATFSSMPKGLKIGDHVFIQMMRFFQTRSILSQEYMETPCI